MAFTIPVRSPNHQITKSPNPIDLMRQLLMNSGGVVVARVPRPVVDRGSVLVRVQYSLISVGTEIAPLRPSAASAPDATAIERGVEYAATRP